VLWDTCLALSSLGGVHANEGEEEIVIDEEDLDVDDLAVDEEDLEVLDDIDGGPSSDVATLPFFPATSKSFTLGAPSSVLIHFANEGVRTFNVTRVGAHFHSPFDLSYYIQNFSIRSLGEVVPPSSEITIEYQFRPEMLEPIDFWFSLWIEYDDGNGREYRSTVYNNTVNLVDGPMEWTSTDFMNYFTWFGGASALYYFYNGGTFASKKSRKSAKPVAAAEAEASSSSAPASPAPAVPVYTQAAKAQVRNRRK